MQARRTGRGRTGCCIAAWMRACICGLCWPGGSPAGLRPDRAMDHLAALLALRAG
ncbi:hypothetical protein [Paracoccus marcusii]|uniref:hypothetical protein n=1 Tax=Paracoccus marcusii TaxID=59779 RepID=UPI002ED59C71